MFFLGGEVWGEGIIIAVVYIKKMLSMKLKY